MKREKNMKKYVAIVIAALTVITVFSVLTTANAQGVLKAPSNVETSTKTVTINLNDIKYVSGPTGNYIIVKGLRLTGIPGEPMLPVKNIQFTLPKGAKVVSVSIEKGISMDFGNYKISPARAPVLKNGYKLPQKFSPPAVNKEVYNNNAFYPQKEMNYEVSNARDGTIVNVHLFPVKYNPVTGKVVITQNLKVTVTYKVDSSRATKAAPIDVPNIIITTPALKQQAQRLADFHNSTGVTSWVVTTDWIENNFQSAGNPPVNGYGNNTTDPYAYFNNYALPLEKSMIKGYNYTLAKKTIAFLQNESSGNNVTYVTIFGNARMVPPSYYWDDQLMYLYAYFGFGDFYDAWIPTDAMYASPNYNSTHFDYTPTFAVGRIPVNNITAKQVVDKIIYYAQHKTAGIQNVTLSGGQVFETPYFLGETGVIEPMNYGWLDGTNITEYFHTLRNFTYNNFVSMMNNSDMIVETTHGSGFSFWHHNDEVSAWDFPMKGTYGSLPVYISGSCLNGAWDEEMYPAYEMSAGINGGTSIAEQMLYSPKGAIAYFGGDREAYGSTYAYFDHGTLVAPNDFGDLITQDGTIAGYYIGTAYGSATLGMMAYYAHAEYAYWIPVLNERDPFGSGLNDNPWARSYFEYSLLGDPALQVAGSGPSNPAYSQPEAIIQNANYDTSDMPIITRGQPVTVNINSTSPTVKAELLYLEQDYDAYYDFILDNVTLTPISSYNGLNNFTYTFTPNREGMYILSIYGEDGKNTRFYMDCQMHQPPGIHLSLKDMKFMHIRNTANTAIKANAPDIQVITLLDYDQVAYGKTTNVTAVVYNSGTAIANNVKVQFYIENYTLVFQSKNLSHPLVWLGNVTVSSIAPGDFVYVTLPWKAVNLWTINHAWDPYNSSARWQYVVANASLSGDSDISNNGNWALFRVHLPVDVWAQKVFIEKDPVYNESNNVSFELTNVGTSEISNTTVYVVDDYETFAVISNVKIAPGQTVFYTVPWTPHHAGYDEIGVVTITPGDNNTRNDVGMYYPNGYDSVTQFMVLTYDVAPINTSVKLTSNANSMEIGVEIYNYGPLKSNATSMDVYLYGGIYSTDVESPHPYPNNYDHVWEIDAPYGAPGMAIHFTYLNVEPGYDYVIIYDQNGSLVAQYTGFYSDLWTDYIHSSKVYVELWSDEGVNYSGFKIDSIATRYVYAGHVNFAPLDSGSFAQTTFNYSTNILGGQIAVKMVSTTSGEYATLSTGGDENNMKIISKYITDSYAPEITGYSPTGIVNSSEPVITINYHDKVYSGFKYINITIDGIKIPSYRILDNYNGNNNGTIKAEVPFMLANGEHEVRVTLVDQGGNTNTTSWMFTVDTIPPALEISSPANGNVPITYDSTLWINGTTDPGANVTINGVAVPVDANGSFNYQATLVEGQNIFVVESKDAVGNTATETVTALYMPELPQLWASINDLYSKINTINSEITTLNNDINNLQNQINSINTQINDLQTQLNTLSAQLNDLRNALDENVTALNTAIENTRTDLVHMINENITSINTQINNISADVQEIKGQISDIQSKNKDQDSAIGTNNILGYAGIALAILAIIIALGAFLKKGRSGETKPEESSPSPEESTEKAETEENEEEALEEI